MFSDYIMLLTVPYMIGLSVILLIIGGGVGAVIAFKFCTKVDVVDDYDKKIAKTSLSNYCNYMGDQFPILLEARRYLLFLNGDGYQTHRRSTLKDHKKEMVKQYRRKRKSKALAI